MEIIRGSLDNISRPASSEQTGSRVSSVSLPHRDRICPTTPFSLVVLSSDAADIQIHSSSKESAASSPNSSVRDPGKDECQAVTTEEEDEDSKLQRAIEEMRRLDEILYAKICREKEIQCQRKELQAKLWQELLNKPEGHSECAHEALNTKLFLALEAPTGTEKEDNFIPVFETQVSECGHDRDNQHLEQSEKKPDSLTGSFEVGYKDKAEDQFESSHCGVPKGMNKQKDFVKRNIELVNGEGGQVFLTQAEKERLAELLQEIDEEEEDSARGADSEGTMWAVSVLTDQGYTPEPSDLEQLIDIDSKIHHLHPDNDFHAYTSSYTDLCMSQGPGSRVGWKCFGDLQPGEKVLQDIKERRGQERRLREIQQQLEILGQGQEMTDRLPDLTEEQLLSLLDECELTERCSQDLQTNHAAP
ncbi:fibrous sheath-interacting protein 1 isoform X2 [Amphiprion ocellaris]|uniref:fibrous sheath-interacting protein 1 isoform X2 n=1 Tax=Amphiprion ocellaris TaxID=80972 RepID=UPI002411038C|nr:fibrous sheath-interacting protein 1 isoform X2 [Amphiprion ocellaris]